MKDALESQDFYELMQAYRHCPLTHPQQTAEAFEAVKAFVLAAAPAPAVPEVMAGPMPPMSEADEKRLNAALTIVFDLACGPADPTMMQDELVAAAESIGMRFPAPAVPDGSVRDKLIEALTREFGDTYDCTRVWEAWHYGNMSQEDFEPVLQRVDDIAESVLGALSAAPVVREPLTFEQRRAIQEAHCNDMAQAYFSARPQLNDKVERRIYEAGFNAGYGIGGGANG